MDGHTAALRPLQLFGLGVLAYGLVKRSWPAGLAGLGLIAFDARRESEKPEFAPLDLVSSR
jgi:hypothetical protein